MKVLKTMITETKTTRKKVVKNYVLCCLSTKIPLHGMFHLLCCHLEIKLALFSTIYGANLTFVVTFIIKVHSIAYLKKGMELRKHEQK